MLSWILRLLFITLSTILYRVDFTIEKIRNGLLPGMNQRFAHPRSGPVVEHKLNVILP